MLQLPKYSCLVLLSLLESHEPHLRPVEGVEAGVRVVAGGHGGVLPRPPPRHADAPRLLVGRDRREPGGHSGQRLRDEPQVEASTKVAKGFTILALQ